jgi:large subunit ribosomal protein L2
MAIRKLRPMTPATRFYSISTFEEITKKEPEKALVESNKKSGGRNNLGRITSRHRGGGHKRQYRIIDFKRNKHGIVGTIAAIEYDPNRAARIALIHYPDGEKRYIIAAIGMKVGAKIVSGPQAEIENGNAMPLKNIPAGTFVHNVEFAPGKGGQIGRSAGNSLQVMAKEDEWVSLKIAFRRNKKISFRLLCNYRISWQRRSREYQSRKSRRSRWLGIRPQSRGMAMNPVDHPMGGGEGRSKSGGGGQHPESPWGKYAKGLKTRKRKNQSNKYIVKRRK